MKPLQSPFKAPSKPVSSKQSAVSRVQGYTPPLRPCIDGDSDELRHLQLLLEDNGAVVLACLGGVAGRRFGLFDNLDRLQAAIAEWSHSDLFTSLNRPGRLKPTNAMTWRRKSIKDAAIVRRTRLFLDFDPVRSRDSNASDAELAASRRTAEQVAAYLAGLDWPEPAIATSGNGTHLLYRCELEAATDLRGLYRFLAERFDSAAVKVDTTVSNAARLCRLYGLPNRKAPATQDRPQRRSFIALPATWDVVTDEHLAAALAALTPPKAPRSAAATCVVPVGSGDLRTLDVDAWADSHGAYLGRSGNRVRIVCPWEDEHTTAGGAGDTVLFDNRPHAWPSFDCRHAHCAHRKIGDLMSLWTDADRFCARTYRPPRSGPYFSALHAGSARP